MVFYGQNKKGEDEERVIIVTCDCNCGQEIHIRKDIYKYNDKNDKTIEYSISTRSSNWYTEQDGPIRVIVKRLKRAWFALRGKDYLYQDICLNEKEYIELLEGMKNLKDTENELFIEEK